MGYQEWKDWRHQRKIRKQLLQELRANLSMLPEKRRNLEAMLDALKQTKLLSGESVRFCSIIYGSLYPSVCEHFSIKERNSLHVIYEYLRVVDSTMSKYCDHVMENLDSHNLQIFVRMYLIQFGDLLKALSDVEDLIKHHLSGTPTDVLKLERLFKQ